MIVSDFVGSCIASVSLAISLVAISYASKLNYTDLVTHLILLSSFAQIFYILLQKTKMKKNFAFKKIIVSLFTALLEFCVIYSLTQLLKNNTIPVVLCTLSLSIGLVVIKNARYYDLHCFALLVVIILTFSFLSVLESYEQNWIFFDDSDIERGFLPFNIPYLLLLFICLGFRIFMLLYSKTMVLLQDCEFFTAVFLFISGLFSLFVRQKEFIDSFDAMKNNLLCYLASFVSFTVFYITIFRYNHGKNFGLLLAVCMLAIHVAYLAFDSFFMKTILEISIFDAYFGLLCVHIFAFMAVLDLGRVFNRRQERQTENRQNNSVDATVEAQDLQN